MNFFIRIVECDLGLPVARASVTKVCVIDFRSRLCLTDLKLEVTLPKESVILEVAAESRRVDGDMPVEYAGRLERKRASTGGDGRSACAARRQGSERYGSP